MCISSLSCPQNHRNMSGKPWWYSATILQMINWNHWEAFDNPFRDFPGVVSRSYLQRNGISTAVVQPATQCLGRCQLTSIFSSLSRWISVVCKNGMRTWRLVLSICYWRYMKIYNDIYFHIYTANRREYTWQDRTRVSLLHFCVLNHAFALSNQFTENAISQPFFCWGGIDTTWYSENTMPSKRYHTDTKQKCNTQMWHWHLTSQ